MSTQFTYLITTKLTVTDQILSPYHIHNYCRPRPCQSLQNIKFLKQQLRKNCTQHKMPFTSCCSSPTSSESHHGPVKKRPLCPPLRQPMQVKR